ncbi:MAG TPA: MoaD/ThiS family protein, partial [Chitinophagaceae bacterium]
LSAKIILSKFVVRYFMSVKVILFGKLADIAGDSVSVAEITDTDSLVEALHKDYPALAKTKYVIAVDKQIINENTLLNKNNMVALLPPFSGG